MNLTDRAHKLWRECLFPGDTVIDATCGNGKDTLFLARLLEGSGHLGAYDIQERAIHQTEALLKNNLNKEEWATVSLHHRSHVSFLEEKAKLIVYNLGYLPGGDHACTTETETTLESLSAALKLIEGGGTITLTCYPGHSEGAREERALLDFVTHLSPQKWVCSHQRLLNRNQAPSLLLIQSIM